MDLAASDLAEKFLERRAIEARAGIDLIVKLLLNDLETRRRIRPRANDSRAWVASGGQFRLDSIRR